jgi:hypothetical protein
VQSARLTVRRSCSWLLTVGRSLLLLLLLLAAARPTPSPPPPPPQLVPLCQQDVWRQLCRAGHARHGVCARAPCVRARLTLRRWAYRSSPATSASLTLILWSARHPCSPLRVCRCSAGGAAALAKTCARACRQGADPVLRVEMASTGEVRSSCSSSCCRRASSVGPVCVQVACFGRDKYEAFLCALLSTGFRLPTRNRTILVSAGPLSSKVEFGPAAVALVRMGYTLLATPGSAAFLK